MTNKRVAKLLAEKAKRDNPPNLLSACFDKQIQFILDPTRLKVAIASRRGGKSNGLGIYLIITALSKPNIKCLYFASTVESARNIMWLHIIFVFLERFNIEYKYNKTLHEVTLNNGSIIKLTGADASDHQIEKALGGKYALCIFDECQNIKHDLERWVYDRIGPAMVDEQGTIVMAGTTGNYKGEHFWYKVTRDTGIREPGWGYHKWMWYDNPHMKRLIEKELTAKIALNPLILEDDGYRQEWGCEWVEDSTAQIYKYNSSRNSCQGVEITKSLQSFDRKWRYIFGMDYGYEDDTALVVGAFNIHDHNCYIVDSYKRPHMLTEEIAKLIIDWRKIYNPVYIVGDAQNKTLIKTLSEQYRISITAAQKLGKEAHIAAMNSDFITGKIKVIEINNLALIKEWEELTWSETQRTIGIYKENPSKDNHLADAALYLHHFSKHYRAIPEKPIDPTISQFRLQAEKALEDKLAEKTYNTAIYDQMESIFK